MFRIWMNEQPPRTHSSLEIPVIGFIKMGASCVTPGSTRPIGPITSCHQIDRYTHLQYLEKDIYVMRPLRTVTQVKEEIPVMDVPLLGKCT
jgi:hypothetical protein